VTRQPAISFSNSFHFPFNHAGGRTSNVRRKDGTSSARPCSKERDEANRFFSLGLILLSVSVTAGVFRFGHPEWNKQIFIFQCYLWPGLEPRPYQYPHFNGTWRAWHENGQLSYEQPIKGRHLWTGPETFLDAKGQDSDCAGDWIGYTRRMTIELEQEDDGRWIAEAPQIPGALAYGGTQAEAISKVEALVLRILADRLDHGEIAPELEKVFTVAA
jgi:predicted RNase H-like HicB family nuclease